MNPLTISLVVNTILFNITGYTAREIGTILSQDFDIAVRTGYHCAPYIHDFLRTREYEGTVRVHFESAPLVDGGRAVKILGKIVLEDGLVSLRGRAVYQSIK